MIIEDNHNAFCYNERYDLEKNFMNDIVCVM